MFLYTFCCAAYNRKVNKPQQRQAKDSPWFANSKSHRVLRRSFQRKATSSCEVRVWMCPATALAASATARPSVAAKPDGSGPLQGTTKKRIACAIPP